MIPDKRLNLGTAVALTNAAWVNGFTNNIDLGSARDFARGKPLYCVVTITTAINLTSDLDGVQFFVRMAPTSAVPVGTWWTHHLIGCSSIYTEYSLPKGEQVVFPIHNGVMPGERDVGAILTPGTGHRYVWGHANIIDLATGALSARAPGANAGAFDVDITTTPPSFSITVGPWYPRGYSV